DAALAARAKASPGQTAGVAILKQTSQALRSRQAKDINEVEKACAAAPESDHATLQDCLTALAIFGRLDAAFRIADKLYPALVGIAAEQAEQRWLDEDVADTSILFAPWMAPLRQDRRIVAVFQRLGLIDYWRAGHRPDFCPAESQAVCRAIGQR